MFTMFALNTLTNTVAFREASRCTWWNVGFDVNSHGSESQHCQLWAVWSWKNYLTLQIQCSPVSLLLQGRLQYLSCKGLLKVLHEIIWEKWLLHTTTSTNIDTIQKEFRTYHPKIWCSGIVIIFELKTLKTNNRCSKGLSDLTESRRRDS